MFVPRNAHTEIEFESDCIWLSRDGGLRNAQTVSRTTEAAFLKDH